MKKSIDVGNLVLKNNILMAPMSGVSDLPFRVIVSKFSPGLVFSEMIASRALIEQNRKTVRMLKKNTKEILAIQIAGCDPKIMSNAAKICENEGADILDINMGCPVKKVTNGYAGSALMKNEDLAIRILESVKKSIKIPLTLKMRTGWDDNSRNAPKLAKIAEKIGVSLITIHGRTRCQMYRGSSDWNFIKRVKNSVNIPVIANGDVKNVEDAHNILKISKADGIMIGRGSYGKPWIFNEILDSFEDNMKQIKINLKELILEHFHLNIEHYGNKIGVRNFRKHLGWYSKKLNNSNMFRAKVNTVEDKDEIEKCIKIFF